MDSYFDDDREANWLLIGSIAVIAFVVIAPLVLPLVWA